MDISSNVVTAALDIVKDNVRLLVGQGINVAELCMEVKRLSRNSLFLAVKLIVEIAGVGAYVLNLNSEAFEIRLSFTSC